MITERCSYCGTRAPAPIELTHSARECIEIQMRSEAWVIAAIVVFALMCVVAVFIWL